MTHPPEELLVQHAFGLADLGDHLDVCASCANDVKSIISASASVPGSPAPDDLLALEATVQAGRSAAKELLDGTSDGRLIDAVEDERILTAGGLEVLFERLTRLRRRDPLNAMAIINRARELSHRAPAELQVDVLRESATTCRVLAAYDSARNHLAAAEELAERLPVSDFALARIWFERARIAIDAQDADGAHWAEQAAEVFLRFGDEGRHLRARYLMAVALYNERDYAGTIRALRDLVPSLESAGDLETLALSWSMIGHASAKDDHLDDALEAFQRALPRLEDLGWPIESARAQWGIARVLLKRGNASEAVALEERVRAAFTEHGLVEESCLVRLDLAEALILLGEDRRAEELCLDVVGTLSGRLSSPDEQRALAYLREVALTPSRIHVVSSFLQEAREHPTAVFTPPSN